MRSSDAAPVDPAAAGRYPLRYAALDRWPLLLGAAVAIAAAAVAAILLLGGGGGSSAGGPAERAVTRTVDGFLGAVAKGDERGCARYVDPNAPAMKKYLRLAAGVPGSGSTCGFVGATGDRVAALTIGNVRVDGDRATVTFDGNATVLHLSDSGRRWLIDGID